VRCDALWKVIGTPASCIALIAARVLAIASWLLRCAASANGPESRDIGELTSAIKLAVSSDENGASCLQHAMLRNANLAGADLSFADLRGADLRDANLRGAKLRDGGVLIVQCSEISEHWTHTVATRREDRRPPAQTTLDLSLRA
jgi:Pentapeptide repeats (8 copies)